MTATTDLRELKSELQKHIEIMDGIESDFKMEGKSVEVSDAQANNYRHSLAEAEKIRGHIEMLEGGAELKSWAAGTGGHGGIATEVAAGLQAAFTAQELKSLGELFLESPEFKALDGGKNGLHMATGFSLETADLGGFGTKDVFTDMTSIAAPRGMVRAQRDALVPRAQRMQRVRDLFPVATTASNLIEYFRVIGFGTTRLDLTSGAAPVRERAATNGTGAPAGDSTDVFGLKPKSNLKFESAQAPVRTIAHYEVAHRNVLADEPQLRSTIDNELLYGLRLEEDKQILLGDGTGENLLGILNTPNIQTYTQANTAGVPDETKADALRRAATKAILAYYPPSGYVIHPYDWEDIELTKADGDGQYVMVTNVSVGADSRAWRQPVIESPAMPEGTFLTGAWGLGAQLYDREQANIRISDQHADFFIRNAVAILAEMRLALAVKRPESFVKGTFVV
jgi:HK97 family phage major capsid protein